jgi:chaperone BCS1
MDIPGAFEQFFAFVKANEFASGGLLVGVTGLLIAALRNLPGRVIRFCWRQVSLEVEIRNETDLFDAVEFWLARNGASGRIRVFSAKYRYGTPDLSDEDGLPDEHRVGQKTAGLELSPGYGHHWIWHRGRPILLFRTAKDDKAAAPFYGKTRESFTLYFLGRDTAPAAAFLHDAVRFCNPPEAKVVRVYSVAEGDWRVSAACRVRQPDTVVLRDGILERLTGDLRRFFDRQPWYTALGIPYRRGYLFTGPPGNGKTTTVLVLAGVFQSPVCILDLANPLLTDEKLRALLNAAPAGAFFLLEDIDALFRRRKAAAAPKGGEESPPSVGITFSGLLNALDGVMAPNGRVVFMSTNHPEKLDPALIRPGRVDVRMEFPNADRGQAQQMFLRFFGATEETERLAEAFADAAGRGDRSMAAIQGLLLEGGDDPERAVELAAGRVPGKPKPGIHRTICGAGGAEPGVPVPLRTART